MSEERQPRAIAGDKVEMEIEIVHEMNVVAVFALFIHETNERVEIELRDVDAPQPHPMSGMERRTIWHPSGKIGTEHIPGIYTLRRINLITASDRYISLDAKEHLGNTPTPGIRVVEEPDSTPYFGTVEFVYDR